MYVHPVLKRSGRSCLLAILLHSTNKVHTFKMSGHKFNDTATPTLGTASRQMARAARAAEGVYVVSLPTKLRRGGRTLHTHTRHTLSRCDTFKPGTGLFRVCREQEHTTLRTRHTTRDNQARMSVEPPTGAKRPFSLAPVSAAA